MTYEQLREHAARIEELAAEESLKQNLFGTRFVSGRGGVPGQPRVDQVLEDAKAKYAGTAAMFDPFLHMPEPSGLASMYEQLFGASEMIATGAGTISDPVHGRIIRVQPVMNKMERVSTIMDTWQGDAAENFKAFFIEPWPAVTANQFSLLSIIAGAVEAERALWQECRNNVDEIAHKGIDALEIVNECSPKEQTFALTVVASIFAVGAAAVATPATGGLAAPVALTFVGATAAAIGDIPKDDAPQMRFDAQSVDGLLDQIRDALKKLAEEVNRKEREIADAMITAADSLAKGRLLFEPARPAMADVSRADLTTKLGLGEHP